MAAQNNAQNNEIVPEKHNFPNPFFSFFQNLRRFFPKADSVVPEKSNSDSVKAHEVENESNIGFVKFPTSRPKVPEPLKLEVDESERTNPAVMWQVYALGGFIVLKWVWARWNERRRDNKEPSDEVPTSDDD